MEEQLTPDAGRALAALGKLEQCPGLCAAPVICAGKNVCVAAEVEKLREALQDIASATGDDALEYRDLVRTAKDALAKRGEEGE